MIARRELLLSVTAIGLGVHSRASSGVDEAPGSAELRHDQPFDALARYCGVYRLKGCHRIGISRFITDSGLEVLFFADYETNLVRPLFAQAADVFAMGPAAGGQAPIELRVRFEADRDGRTQRLTLISPAGTETPAERTATRDEEVTFVCGGARLAGTLTIPEGGGPCPAVVLLHGSGPLTRHSFGHYPRFFSSLGMAVLAFDKRGTGASTGRLFDASIGAPETLWSAFYPDDLAADASAALAYLRTRPEIDASRIGFWGSSEGGMLSTYVAAHAKNTAFAINSSGFVGPLWETILYQGAAMLRAGGAPESEVGEALAFNRYWMDVARTGVGYEEYLLRRQAIVQAGKITWLFYYSGTYTSLEQMRWSWSHILAFNSLPTLQRVSCPVLGIFGQADALTDSLQASSAMRQTLAAGGNHNVTTVVIPNATHSLMTTSREGMAPGVFSTLSSWCATHVTHARTHPPRCASQRRRARKQSITSPIHESRAGTGL